MRYPPQIIDQLKARLNIVDEVRKVIPTLKKRGKYWWANCPFHSEKSASFHVREEGNYYCFGCGASGDVITFIQETQGGTFNEIIHRLAKQVGLALPELEVSNPAAVQQRQSGLEALERAAVFYQRCLPGSPGEAYFRRRGLSVTTLEEFQLGFAPDAWTELTSALTAEGLHPSVLRTAGLTSEGRTGKGDYDRFRGRVMFPIHNIQGKVVGFGGRIMDSGEPKYLNSPETPYFSKANLLYNLHRARQHLKQPGAQLVVVEGYMDVISLWQAGFKTAVAPLGTSITEEQVGLMWHQYAAPIFCLDGDAAGRAAAIRAALKLLPNLEPGKTVQFVWLPPGEDPDSLVQKDGIGAFRQLLAQPLPLEQVLWQYLTTDVDLASADGRTSVSANLIALLNTIRHAIVRRHYGEVLKDKLYQATRANNAATGGGGGGVARTLQAREEKAPTTYRPKVQGDATTQRLLAIVCRWPEILPHIDESFASLSFPPGPLAELAQHINRAYTVQRLSPEELKSDLASGPHAHTVQNLIRSTGVGGLSEVLGASPRMMFNNEFQQMQSVQQDRRELTTILKNMQDTDWKDPAKWEEIKALHKQNTALSDPDQDQELSQEDSSRSDTIRG